MCRHARAAELSGRAARQAETLFGGDSFTFVQMVWSESTNLGNLATLTAGDEQLSLFRRAWALLLPLHAVLLRRIASNLLLPGLARRDEVECYAHLTAAVFKAKNRPVPCHAVLLERFGGEVGYATLLGVLLLTLNLLPLPLWAPTEAASAQSFVLDALDVVPLTNDLDAPCVEADVVAFIEDIDEHPYDPAFRDAVLRKWRSPAVRKVLRSRGTLQTGVAKNEEAQAEFNARRRADIEKIGLRECAWPSCDKVERTVREFKQCSGCRSVWYCSAEHQMLDWGAHRKACGEMGAARKKSCKRGCKGKWRRGFE